MRTPTLVLNRTSFEKQFGTDTAISEMTDQVRQFKQLQEENVRLKQLVAEQRLTITGGITKGSEALRSPMCMTADERNY